MADSDDKFKRIKAKVERAAQDAGSTSLRRGVFRELIHLVHSPQTSLQSKSYAAGQIPRFFNDFPDLEEEAINAVYDLCEDHDSKVRIDGYNAVTQVSYAQHRWVKRNADVLVQLLQSDEPEEVAVVKTALLKHLDMDPPAVLGVMCDQVVPLEEDLDEFERQTRERLRSLVIMFLATDALGVIVEKYTDPPDSEAEQVLVSQLVLSIRGLEIREVELVVRDILLSLPCYRVYPSRGDSMLLALLDRAKESLQQRAGNYEPLSSTRSFLALAQFVAIDRHAASPAILLQFYLSFLMGRMVLQKFSPQDRVDIISWISETLLVCDAEMDKLQQASSQDQLRRLLSQTVDASSLLLEILFDSKVYNPVFWRTVETLLQAVSARKKRDNWTLPSHLISVIRKFQELLVQNNENTTDIQNLIRLLTDNQSIPLNDSAQTPREMNNKLPERPSHLPEPPAVNLPRQKYSTTQHAHRRSLVKDIVNKDTRDSTSNPMIFPKRSNSSAEGMPETKRAKIGLKGQPAPSLLSRLAGTESTGAFTSEHARRRRRGKRESRETSPELEKHPMTGYSIKGAASAHRSGRNMETVQAASLLGRLESVNDPARDDLAGRWE
ncbi:apoptosis inhibitory protein 5-domain-containing protein [Pisolithus marmoratus]|nr:apoptosis inhibitory protein 5-domain-containing protein [Pisolithus marmoratus]